VRKLPVPFPRGVRKKDGHGQCSNSKDDIGKIVTMGSLTNTCACMTTTIHGQGESIDTLETIRTACPALRSVFLPDDAWPEFKAWHQNRDDVAEHRSMLLLALKRGHLARLTSSIHRYLIKNGAVSPEVRQQYVKDLAERWMHHANALERHRRSRRFNGRIAELQCAEWLETRGWTIVGLEALRQGSDIEAKSDSGIVTAFEVKFIGSQDVDSDMILRSMADGPSAYAVSPYAAINYLLFRVYEASKQLAAFNGHRIAVAVIDDLTWPRFDMQLENGWIDWSNPVFFEKDPEWDAFMKTQQGRYPNLCSELQSVVGQIDKAWIIRRKYGYEYHPVYELKPGRT
jgi:hypothetical protein